MKTLKEFYQALNSLKIFFILLSILATIILTAKQASCESVQCEHISVWKIERFALANVNYEHHNTCFFSNNIMKELLRITPEFTHPVYGNDLKIKDIANELEQKFDETHNLVYLHALAKLLVDYAFYKDEQLFTHPALSCYYDFVVHLNLINLCHVKYAVAP